MSFEIPPGTRVKLTEGEYRELLGTVIRKSYYYHIEMDEPLPPELSCELCDSNLLVHMTEDEFEIVS